MSGDSVSEDPKFQLGVVTGNLNALRDQFGVHLASTDARFTRLEDKITEGFAAMTNKLETLQKSSAGTTGGIRVLDKLAYFVIVLLAACLGPVIAKHL